MEDQYRNNILKYYYGHRKSHGVTLPKFPGNDQMYKQINSKFLQEGLIESADFNNMFKITLLGISVYEYRPEDPMGGRRELKEEKESQDSQKSEKTAVRDYKSRRAATRYRKRQFGLYQVQEYLNQS